MWDFIKRQGATILRTYAMYEPLRTFSYIALPFGLVGVILLGRFAVLYFEDPGAAQGRYIQSVIIGGFFLLLGFLIFLFGVLSDVIAANRRLTEETLYRIRRLELEWEEQRREWGKGEQGDKGRGGQCDLETDDRDQGGQDE
jgi:hypothetical protein